MMISLLFTDLFQLFQLFREAKWLQYDEKCSVENIYTDLCNCEMEVHKRCTQKSQRKLQATKLSLQEWMDVQKM